MATVWVRMLEYVSGGRHDGTQWPDKNSVLEVPDWEGKQLVGAGLAEPAPAPPRPEPPPAPPAPPASAPAVPQAAAEDTPSAEPATAALPVPAPADPKAAWIEYAMSHGASEDDANTATKAQLMAAYGGRLLYSE